MAIGLAYLVAVATPGPWANTSVTVWDWPGAALIIVGPLVAGGAAWWWLVYSRTVAEGAWRVGNINSWAWVGRLRPVLQLWGVHLAAVIATLLVGWWRGTAPQVTGMPLIISQLASLTMFGSLGVAAATLVRHVVVAPLVAVAAFLMPVAAYGRVPRSLFVIGGAAGVPSALVPDATFIALQSWLCLGVVLAAEGMVLALARIPCVRRRGVLLGIAFMVVGVGSSTVAAARLTGAGAPDRFTRSTPWSVRCATTPWGALCLGPDQERARPAVEGAVDAVLGVTTELGVPAPTLIEQGDPVVVDADPVSAGARLIDVPAGPMTSAALLARPDFAVGVLGEQRCLNTVDVDAEPEARAAVLAAATWVSYRAGASDLRLSADVQAIEAAGPAGRAWVGRTLRLYAGCDLSAVTPVPS